MTHETLRSHVDVRQHYLRSAHIEQHESELTAGYVPTARALEVLHRIGHAMEPGSAGRAWSITGPYGAGKSSFGLFLHALLGPTGDLGYQTATANLQTADPDASAVWQAGRVGLEADQGGFIRAVATAQRENIVDTVLRAMKAGVASRWSEQPPADVTDAVAAAADSRTPRAISDALVTLTRHAPVLIVIDEFGKNLEYFADNPDSADLFVLQELAERCTGRHGLPAFLVTMQHLAFDDYVRGADAVQRREWGKIQGRFQDVPFLESAEQSARLVAAAFSSDHAGLSFISARERWVDQQEATLVDLGLMRMIPGGRATLVDCYPLHPLTLLTLPDMCARFGQHGRTLFSFLTGREPYSAIDFLDKTATPTTGLPSVGLPQLFDFFVSSGGAAGGNHISRLIEISTTIREATGLTPAELDLLKTIGVLNLTAQSGPLRASLPVMAFATNAQPDTTQNPTELRAAVEELEHRGLLTYRGFADEFRLWQGTDLHLPSVVANAKEETARTSAADLLDAVHKMPPAIAGRHSQDVGMLRYFDTTFADRLSPSVRRPGVADPADGLIVYYLDDPDTVGELSITEDVKPVIIVTTEHHAIIVEAVRELAAVQAALRRDDVHADHVARRELQERAADAQRRLTDQIAQHLSPAASGTQFRVDGADEDLPKAPALSPLLSQVCDTVYYRSPHIRNEMLGRRELTSQAAKARRELLEAMVRHEHEEWLGLTGFGPEKAMYAALLKHTRMHVQNSKGGFGFAPPVTGELAHAWNVVESALGRSRSAPLSLQEIYDRLMAPPIGLTDGPIPVLLTAVLLYYADNVAIYQEGTYQPTITPELLERLVKSPDRFTVRQFEVDNSKNRVLAGVAAALTAVTGQTRPPTRAAAGRRNIALLSVAGPLLAFARGLPDYTRRTAGLPSDDAAAVRAALLSTTAPEQLLFVDLPQACGIEPFSGPIRDRGDDVDLFNDRITTALEDLRDTYRTLLTDCAEILVDELRTGDGVSAMRLELQGQSAPLAGSILEPRLRSFIALISDRHIDDDDAWLEAVLNNVVTRPPATWRDDDFARFKVEVRALASAYRRVLALHYEARSAERAGFDAQRVTLTKPDGTEHSSVVWINHRDRPELESILDQARAAVGRILGAQGESTLLALLADSVLRQQDETERTIQPTAGGSNTHEQRRQA